MYLYKKKNTQLFGGSYSCYKGSLCPFKIPQTYKRGVHHRGAALKGGHATARASPLDHEGHSLVPRAAGPTFQDYSCPLFPERGEERSMKQICPFGVGRDGGDSQRPLLGSPYLWGICFPPSSLPASSSSRRESLGGLTFPKEDMSASVTR